MHTTEEEWMRRGRGAEGDHPRLMTGRGARPAVFVLGRLRCDGAGRGRRQTARRTLGATNADRAQRAERADGSSPNDFTHVRPEPHAPCLPRRPSASIHPRTRPASARPTASSASAVGPEGRRGRAKQDSGPCVCYRHQLLEFRSRPNPRAFPPSRISIRKIGTPHMSSYTN